MHASESRLRRSRSRRAFLERGLAAGAASAGMSLLAGNPVAFAEDEHSHLTRGDVAMLRFAAAAEILESDLWTVNLDAFRTLPGSSATRSSGQPRLTNLTQLTMDASWWTRYRSSEDNPDLNPNFAFPPAVPGLNAGQFTAIPRTDSDLAPDAHIQAIANTAVFHMATIEQGGTSRQRGGCAKRDRD
jgi:hypothetical protein